MALTIGGYRILREKLLDKHIKELTVRPYVPTVFKKPQYVVKYPIYHVDDKYAYLPKQYGIEVFGKYTQTTRKVEQTDDKYWEFKGSLRPLQLEVVNTYTKDGIISLQTGGGKTVCALYIASRIKKPAIILVHTTFLKDQWIERTRQFLPHARIGIVQGKTFDIDDKDIVIVMLQTVSKQEYPKSTFSKFGLVIVDECHHIASECFSRAIPKLTCEHMLGLSATPERQDKLMFVINWFLGPILYQSSSDDKVDSKICVQVFICDSRFEMEYNQSGVMFTALMINKVVSDLPRNKLINEIINSILLQPDRKILLLTDRVEHAKTLFNNLDNKDLAGILNRDVNAIERSEICDTKRLLIATYQMCKEAFDVSTLNTLIMATSRPDVDQIVGRILRIEKGKRTVTPLIIDIYDSIFDRQFGQRKRLYTSRKYEIIYHQKDVSAVSLS
jgi:superfamily II DNA or RNA helicase